MPRAASSANRTWALLCFSDSLEFDPALQVQGIGTQAVQPDSCLAAGLQRCNIFTSGSDNKVQGFLGQFVDSCISNAADCIALPDAA